VEYDDVIVGGGSAGAVLAARLSEDPARRVVLLEAGPDYPTLASVPDDLQDCWRMSLRAHDWGLTAEAGPGRAIPYPRGRVVGGSSAVNAAIALRGVPGDYDEWAALGNEEWSWAKVLPLFRRLEDDPEPGDGELHGRGGPVPICRWRPEELIATQRAFFDVCRRLGFADVGDHNHPHATGVGPFPQNRRGRLRLSAATCYLLPARHRPNLTIRPDCLVSRVVIERERAAGVEVQSGAHTERVYGRRITLAAGDIGSPAILLRSGIGPKATLDSLGIEPVADLPGVGANLADHPAVAIDLECAPADGDPPIFQLVATAHSSLAQRTGPPDLQLVACGPYPAAGGRTGCMIAAALLKPASRGRVRLRDAGLGSMPEIDLGYFRDPADLPRLLEGLRLADQAARHPALAGMTGGRRLGPPPAALATAAAAAGWIRSSAWTYHHPVGTCAMGLDPAAGAVVDPDARVYGVDGLSVADASILPEIPSANTNIPVIMVAEHVAARRTPQRTARHAMAGAS
jgi:choline dehydrogenase